MYVALNTKRSPLQGMVVRFPMNHRLRKRMGDSCWLDARTGAQVCGAGDPTGQTNCTVTNPYNTPNANSTAPNGATWSWSLSGSTLTGTPLDSKNKRTYQFMYHAGYSDVYQLTNKRTCEGGGHFSCTYVVVAQGGQTSFASAPPSKNEIGCSNITTAVASPTGVQTVTAAPVSTWTPQAIYGGTSTSVQSGQGLPVDAAGAIEQPWYKRIPTWGWAVGGGAAVFFGTKMLGRR